MSIESESRMLRIMDSWGHLAWVCERDHMHASEEFALKCEYEHNREMRLRMSRERNETL